MLLLTIRTDRPEAEISLYADNQHIDHKSWQAHQKLAETLHLQVLKLLKGKKADWSSIEGIVVYEGPGSFTGLRIGLSIANALAYSLSVPIIGRTGIDWCEQGISRLLIGETQQVIIPEYGAPVHITLPSN